MIGEGDAPRHYAVRRLNPYEGVLQVVETHDGRAYSPNGQVWQVQVLAQRPDHTWHSFSQISPILQFFNFGLWDADDGLRRIPANPVLDIGAMSAAAQSLCDTLRGLSDLLPFTLIDDHECWATDHQGRPVALLASTEDPGLIGELRVERWQATRLGEHGFVSDALLARGIPAHGDLGPRQHAEELERQVRRIGQHKAWYRRLADGGGVRLQPPGEPAHLPADAFPPLGLRSDWPDPDEAALAADYLAWIAPQLLMLQHLDDDLRDRLEGQACRRAEALEAGYRLIPRVIDRRRLEAARVEARLRRAAR